MKPILLIFVALVFAGCSLLEDSATSIAYDIERGVGRLGNGEGSTHVIVHAARDRAATEVKSLTVQFDKVGALIVWYRDGEGKVIESGSTSYHSRFVDTPETIILDKLIDSPLHIEVQRRNGRAAVVKVF